MASLGDGSAPQRGVGVEQSDGWLRWIQMVFALAVSGLLLELLLDLYSILVMPPDQ